MAFNVFLCYYYNGECMDIKLDDKIENDVKKSINFKKILLIVCSIFICIFLIIIYCRYKATSGLKVNEYKVTDSALPQNFHGVKVVHFSDIYYGNTVSIEFLKEIVSSINEIKPDIVVFTGDLLSKEIDVDTKNEIISILGSITSSIGKYAIKGDSDNSLFNEIIASSGFTILDNSSLEIYYKGDTPIVIGNGDFSSDFFSILLVHEPDMINDYNNSFNLVLSGHSLGGQINLPFIRNLFLPSGSKKYYNGYYNVNGSNLYVSSGIGTTNFKYRFNNKPSVNLYRLTSY